MHAEHQARSLPPEVQAAWLHHRFTQIHPFADGNGRVARAIASLVFIKSGWFPLIVKRDDWSRYIEALENADCDDLRPLVSMFVESQRNALIQATEVAYDVRPIESADEAIAAVRDRLLQRGKLPLKEWLVAKQIANQLTNAGAQRFNQIAGQLTSEIGVAKGFSFGVSSGSGTADSVRAITRAAHIADLGEYSVLLQLSLNTGRSEALSLSFYAIGPRFRGLIGVVAYLSLQGAEPTLIEGTFQINYEEDLPTAQARFSAWLERVIVAGLTEWRRSL